MITHDTHAHARGGDDVAAVAIGPAGAAAVAASAAAVAAGAAGGGVAAGVSSRLDSDVCGFC